MIPIIGGKLDGQQAHGRVIQLDEKGETYILISFDELVGDKKVRREFYLKTDGPTIEEAMKTYKEREKLSAAFK